MNNNFKLSGFAMTLLLVLLGSCSNDRVNEPELSPPPVVNVYAVPIGDAIERAERLMGHIGSPSTRGLNRKICKIEMYRGLQTRSDEENVASYYVINYEDNQGFAVVGADKRVAGIYAISDEGNLTMTD